MKYFFNIICLFIIGFTSITINAQLPLSTNNWSGYIDASPHGNFSNIPTGTGVTFSQWRRHNNATFINANDGYNSQNLNGNPTGKLAAYIKTDANTSFNITQVSFVVRRSNTGPGNFKAYLYSPATSSPGLNTGVLTLIGTGNLNSTNNYTFTFNTNFCMPPNDSVEIRLVLDKASHPGGTFRIVNGTSIVGTTNMACNMQNVAITPPPIVCIGSNAIITLTSAPNTSIVYNVNHQNILGVLTLDTVTTNNSGNTSIILNNVTTTNTVSIISAFTSPCCAINIMQDVTITPQAIDTPIFTQLGPYCSGAPLVLPTSSNNGVTGSWSPSINNTATTTYTFTPNAGQCVSDTPDMTIVVFPAPETTESATICYGESYTFNGINYTTSNNTAKDTFTVVGGCDSIVTLNLTVLDMPQSFTLDLEGCEQVNYNNQIYTQSTTLIDTFTSTWGCDSIYNIVNIKIHDGPVQMNADTSGCGEVWVNGLRHTTSTVVNDTLYNTFGCDSVYREFNITVHEPLNLSYSVFPEEPYLMERFLIEVVSNQGNNFEILNWYPSSIFYSSSDKKQFISLSEEQDIFVTGRTSQGCEDSLKISVKLKSINKDLSTPNAFTPNGDGLNDVFVPKLNMERAYNLSEFKVFNRYGQLVHSTANMYGGWDGTFNGKALDSGIYYYMITITFLDGSVKKINGDVTLIR